MNIHHLLKKHAPAFHPLFRPQLTADNTYGMDLSIHNPEMKTLDFDKVEQMHHYIFGKIDGAGKKYGYGGYMEDREVYRRSKVFSLAGGNSRSIHLGIDVWTPAGTTVFCPTDARVHSFQNNDHYGDYGPTIILEHTLEDTTFFTLYGHLSLTSLEGIAQGMSIGKGQQFCQVGNFPENGDWPPHLHFQVITDMMDKKGDFFGVCAASEKEKFQNLCPNPTVFFDL